MAFAGVCGPFKTHELAATATSRCSDFKFRLYDQLDWLGARPQATATRRALYIASFAMLKSAPQQRNGYFLVLLTAIYVVNCIDRLMFGVLLQDIKRDMALTDAQLGVLAGLAFSLFFAVMGIPIGRLADRGNRVTIISVCAITWSAAVALCGAAGNFVQMALMRMGVATGEAGCYPTSLALIADRFPRGERPRALSRYFLAYPISIFVGFLTAGWLNQLYGWRWTFVIFGLPGLLLGSLAWLTLSDVRTHHAAGNGPFEGSQSEAPPFKAVARTLWASRTLRNIFLFNVGYGFFGFSTSQWLPALFQRSYGLSSGQVGTAFALIQGTSYLIGTVLGGELASRLAFNDERRQLIGAAICYVIMAAAAVGIFTSPDYRLALLMLAIYATAIGASNGPVAAIVTVLLPSRMRALGVSAWVACMYLFGSSLGPLVVGLISDASHAAFGLQSLRFALLVLTPGYLWCGWLLFKASRTVEKDIASAGSAEGDAASFSRAGESATCAANLKNDGGVPLAEAAEH